MQRTNPSKNQNCWYFIRPMQKTRLSENRTQSMHPDKQGALINRQIKNVDISLDQSKKTIPPKVCTLTILGLHALARWRSRQNCCKTIGFTTLRAPHSRWRKCRQRVQKTLTHFSWLWGVWVLRKGYIPAGPSPLKLFNSAMNEWFS